MNSKGQNHIVVVEAYEGFIEYLSDESEERNSFQGLGLPVEEIAEHLDCRITILCWDQWYRYELKETWGSTPATRPVSQPDFSNMSRVLESSRIKRIPIPARDPEYWLLFDEKGLSPRSHGLINDSGLLFFVSYCLSKELRVFYNNDPFQVVILPMWGGVGYVSQMARATQVSNMVDVPFVVVATDKSINRQMANQEGIWTRQAIVQRQMEDVSLALADLVLIFGPRGNEIAIDGRLPESPSPVCAPRFVEDLLVDKIANASAQPADTHSPLEFFLHEPQQAASGVLTLLDAVTLLTNKGIRLNRPVISAGPPMIFAPMKPRTFMDYWSSRGSVRELIREHQWEWRREYSYLDQVFRVRLYLSFFDYLPNVWAELARGSLVLLSPSAAEGLAPGKILPQEVLIQGDPVPEKVADSLEKIAGTDIKKLDQIRRELCARVVEAHRGKGRRRLIEKTTKALGQILQSPPEPQDLSRISLMFFDRRVSLRTLAQKDKPPPLPEPRSGIKKGTLSVVVICYEEGSMIKEALDSVWASERQPDEVLLVDDGSHGDETLTNIRELEKDASKKGFPLRVIQQRNRGLASARNAGLGAAKGEFISFLDGDDMIEPQFYRIALEILERYPRLGGVAAWALLFGADITDGFWNAPQPEFPFLFIENSIIVPCLTRTELLRDLGGYDIRQRYNYEDWELGIRMLVSGWPIVTVPMHLLKYRVRTNSLYRSMTYVQNQVMRELLLNTHRETVSKFSVEIAMQLENQWMKSIHPDLTPPISIQGNNNTVSFCRRLSQKVRRLLTRTLITN
ncbi:MAG: hypothetical protein A3G93_16410 [Nitrospinae bacterium RIFCSPLOWO2_12_FULL_45_22]|nr:MAG: hypothetical protein A3G93_16410 [Nitrospinae bacterium RIFCSPLOWO2_12_FULL_45_22]